jgi:cytochrome b561
MHEPLGNVLLVLVGLHVAAALWHHFSGATACCGRCCAGLREV